MNEKLTCRRLDKKDFLPNIKKVSPQVFGESINESDTHPAAEIVTCNGETVLKLKSGENIVSPNILDIIPTPHFYRVTIEYLLETSVDNNSPLASLIYFSFLYIIGGYPQSNDRYANSSFILAIMNKENGNTSYQ